MIKKYLEWLATFDQLAGRVAKHQLEKGRAYISHEPNQEQIAYLKDVLKGCDHQPQKCYYNSQKLACIPRIQYVEGYAVGTVQIPFDHGWCILDGEIVIDVTWPIDHKIKPRNWLDNRVTGIIPANWAYFGVVIHRQHVFNFWHKEGIAGQILPSLVLKGVADTSQERKRNVQRSKQD